jgi:hypothetical protein
MPGVSSSRMRRASMAGGTTSERIDLPDEGGGSNLLWILGVLVVGASLAIWATQCRGEKRRDAPAATAVDENAPVAGSAPVAPSVDDLRPSTSSTGNPDPSFAADALEGELAGERLFATVQVLGEVLDVRSAFCNEARLGEIIGRKAGELRSAGVVRVRCSETYGTQVFERAL